MKMSADDRKAAELFRLYSRKLFNTAFRITLSSEESDEIMQRTLIRYFSRGDGEPEPVNIWAWLRTVCVRMSIDFMRRKNRFVNLDEALSGDAETVSPEESDCGEVDWENLGGDVFPMVLELLSGMPDKYRTVLTLRLIEEYEYPEMASVLGISESGVRSRYMRGRRMLAQMLSEKLRKGQ